MKEPLHSRSDEERELLERIWANPSVDGARLVYADWLMERGDPRGEFIRMQLESAALLERDPRKLEYERRASVVMHQHRLEWAPIANAKIEWRFIRGFPSTAKLAASNLPDFIDELESVRSLESFELNFDGVNDANVVTWARVLSHRVFARLRSLQLTWHIPQKALALLLAQPWISRLESLQLSYVALHEDVWSALGSSTSLRELQTLDVGLSGATDFAVQSLAELPWPKLKRLTLSNNQLGTASCVSLVKKDSFPALEHLDVSWNRIGKRGGVMLTSAEWFKNLRTLDLSHLQVGDETCAAIVEAKPPRLRWLGLAQSRCTENAMNQLERALPTITIARK